MAVLWEAFFPTTWQLAGVTRVFMTITHDRRSSHIMSGTSIETKTGLTFMPIWAHLWLPFPLHNNRLRLILQMACMCNATRLTVFPSDAVRGFRLAMSRAFPVSADRTFVWASLHLVRGHRIWRPIAHLVVAVKACGLALWLRFMGLKRTVHSRIVEICSISHSGVLTSQSGDPLSWIRAFLFLLSFYWHF